MHFNLCLIYHWQIFEPVENGHIWLSDAAADALNQSVTGLTVATQQTFFLQVSHKTTKQHVFNNSLLCHLPVGLCKEA